MMSQPKETIERISGRAEPAALDYHALPRPGKLSVETTKRLLNADDLSLAYSPGVAVPCEVIAANPLESFRYTGRGNLVGVITNGTAVLGLGPIGPLAAKPVMEGKAALFKRFAGIDVFDIEVAEQDPQRLIDLVAALEPTFGGINLEDIRAPECFVIEKELRRRMRIPVFHDDQHGTAVVVAAAVVNGLEVVGKPIDQVKVVVSGAGAAAIACVGLLVEMGLPRENVWLTDTAGLIYQGRMERMDSMKSLYAQSTRLRTLADAMQGADIFLGLSKAGVLKPEMLVGMQRSPLILALANPIPEMMPEEIRHHRPDAVIATGRSDYPNQVNNVLCFPYIFRGALDVGATTITRSMEIATVRAIAELARSHSLSGSERPFGPEYLIPTPFDPRLILQIAPAVAHAAMADGVCLRPRANMNYYSDELRQRVPHAVV